jgi:hypothetical protein
MIKHLKHFFYFYVKGIAKKSLNKLGKVSRKCLKFRSSTKFGSLQYR